jgi:response regulator RpfG family c-di-GMP phosphodiesterase
MVGVLDTVVMAKPETTPHTFRRAPKLLCDEPVNVLLVEDVTSDALLLRLALDASRLPYTMHTLRQGDSVLPWLIRAEAQHTLPDVILLDLGLPNIDGFEILADLATASPALRAIPIVILTGFEDFEYVRSSYNLPVAAYLTKPCNKNKMRTILGQIKRQKAQREGL